MAGQGEVITDEARPIFWRRSEAKLCSIIIPIVASDIETRLPKIFRLWSDIRFFPVLKPREPQQHLIIIVNNANHRQIKRILEIYSKFPGLSGVFKGISAINAGLTGERDLYVRDAKTLLGRFGNKSGPNLLFQSAMKAAQHYGGFTFQAELDCLPTGPDWLPALEALVVANARAWVIGTIFSGEFGLVKKIQSHLNGNAIYKAGDPDFQRFLDEHWIPGVIQHAQKNPGIGYDTWWAVETVAADPKAGNEAWQLYRKYDSFFRNDPFMTNLRGKSIDFEIAQRRLLDMRMLDRAPLFLHCAGTSKVLDLLLYRSDLDMIGALDWLSLKLLDYQYLRRRLLDLNGPACVISTISYLLTQPRGMIALLEEDLELTAHLTAALQAAAVTSGLRSHYNRTWALASDRLQFRHPDMQELVLL